MRNPRREDDLVVRERKTPSGFTLIELLVVVAILSILVALATVHYQQAQAKSKVARTKADMRVIQGALAAYRVDCRHYPPAARGDIQLDLPLWRLTSPVAYLSAIPADPFGAAPFDFMRSVIMRGYSYKDKRTTSRGMPGQTFGHIWRLMPEKEYFLHSCGPNIVWDVMPYTEYDPTNGIRSRGDICVFGPM